MSNLLFEDQPLVISPTLATRIGLNESIFIQQLHYWIKKSQNVEDGRKWVYNTYKQWQEQFPFWSEITIRRIATSLENKGIILTANYNAMKADKTKWYTIDYEILEGVISPCDQNDQSLRSNRSDGCDQNDQSNTRDYTEITTETEEENAIAENNPAEDNPFIFYEQNIHPIIKPMVREDMIYLLDGNFFDTPKVILIEAMRLAVRKEKNWDYAYKVLVDWRDRKFRTLDEVRTYVKGFEQRYNRAASGNQQAGRSRGPVAQDKLPETVKRQLEREQQGGKETNQNQSTTVMDDPELRELLESLRAKQSEYLHE